MDSARGTRLLGETQASENSGERRVEQRRGYGRPVEAVRRSQHPRDLHEHDRGDPRASCGDRVSPRNFRPTALIFVVTDEQAHQHVRVKRLHARLPLRRSPAPCQPTSPARRRGVGSAWRPSVRRRSAWRRPSTSPREAPRARTMSAHRAHRSFGAALEEQPIERSDSSQGTAIVPLKP